MNKKSAQKQKRHLIQRLLASRCSIKKKSSKRSNQKTHQQTKRPAARKRVFTFVATTGFLSHMNQHIQSILNVGADSIIVEVECQLSNGLPTIIIVGLGNKAVDEAKERVRSAFTSAKIQLPRKRITINLAPADTPKNSSGFDLAIAAAILSKECTTQVFDKTTAVIGEVGLNGDVKPVRGIIGKLLGAKKLGVTSFLIPVGNTSQAELIEGIRLFPIATITNLRDHILGTKELELSQCNSPVQIPRTPPKQTISDITGQNNAKRALQIAAAGNHNILLTGPPGTGKSMLAKALPGLLPPLTHDEVLEITHLHSLVSNNYESLVTERPFRTPHHSASHVSIIGGGLLALPGEATLSHRGILFLDELPEFSRTTLEALRQPLEDKTITVARSRHTIHYPADFILVATANPCPCGFYGGKMCICTLAQIQHYQQKISGPIADRIDLFVYVDNVNHNSLLSIKPDEQQDTAHLVEHIASARRTQRNRLGSTKCNANMNNEEIRQRTKLHPESIELLSSAANRLHLSARAYMRIIKVSQTIADLEKSETILPAHVSEALQYRRPSKEPT